MGALVGAGVIYPGALAGADAQVIPVGDSAIEVHVSTASLTLRFQTRCVPVNRGDVLELHLDGRPVFRLSGNGRFAAAGNDVIVETAAGPTSARIELALTEVVVAGPIEDFLGSWGASMAWDPDRGRLIRVGGSLGDAYDTSTWAWGETTGWVDLGLPSPPPRHRGGLVWDPVRHALVLFGGYGASGLLDDTWELTPSGWTRRFPAHSPPPRWALGLAWDERRSRAVLFGGLQGIGQGTEFDDTWEWDGVDWVQATPVLSPPGRDAHGMAWDGNLGEIVVFGGWDGFNVLGDAWSWDGARWRLLPFTSPPPRASTALAWDPVRRLLVLTGGYDPRGPHLADTWTFDGLAWSAAPAAPEAWKRMALASHPSLGVVAFGGSSDTTAFGFTLNLTPAGWRMLDRTPPRGELLRRGASWEILQDGWAWKAAPARWRRGLALPFLEVRHAAQAGGTVLAITSTDGGEELWSDDGITWRPHGNFAGPTHGLIADRGVGTFWLVREDSSLEYWPPGGSFRPAGSLADAGRLAAAHGQKLYLVGERVNTWDALTGALAPHAPLPFPDAGAFSLVVEPRRDVLVASLGPGADNFAEWDGRRWDSVPAPPGGIEWKVDHGGELFGWGRDGGLVRYRPQRELGAACVEGRQCRSGFCTDGVCCESSCGAEDDCEVCAFAAGGWSDGQCSAVRAGFHRECGAATPCELRVCAPGFAVCPPPIPVCEPDAGRRDAGPPPGPPVDVGVDSEAPPSCGCGAAQPALSWWILALAGGGFARRRRASYRLRQENSRDSSTAP